MNFLTKYRGMAIQAKASIWYTICNFFQKGVSFIVIPIYVHFLTPAEYGEWSVFQSWRDILIIFASLNLFAGVYTKTLVDNKDDRNRYTSSMQGLGTTVSVALFILYLLSHKWCNNVLGLTTPYMLLLFIYFIVYPAFSFWSTRQRVEYKYKPMVVVTILVSVITPTVSLILLKGTNLRARALILGYLIVQCVIGLVFYVYHFWTGKCFFNKYYWKYALKYNIPLIPHYLSLIVLGQSDRIMIKYYCGDSDAGVYSFAYQIASIMNVVLSAINGSRVPWSYEQLRDESYNKLRVISNALCVLMGGITLIAALFSPDIIRIIGTEEYSAAVYVIPIVALGVYFTFCYDMFCTVEFYYGATKYVMIASVVGAISNIVLNAILIPQYGFIAAAYTTLISYILFMVMHYVFMKKVLRDNNIEQDVYDIKFTFLCSALLCILSALSIISYYSTIARYAFIGIIVIATCLNKKKIIWLIKSMKG